MYQFIFMFYYTNKYILLLYRVLRNSVPMLPYICLSHFYYGKCLALQCKVNPMEDIMTVIQFCYKASTGVNIQP